MPSWSVQGPLRRFLLMLTTLFFAILFLEVVLGHQLVFSQRRADPAIFPIVIVPVGLVAVVWAQIRASAASEAALEAAMVLAVFVGLAGAMFHLQASGVRWDHPARLFAASVWRGPACPNWPLAISFAGALGAISAYGLGRDTSYLAATRGAPPAARAGMGAAWALLFPGMMMVFVPPLAGIGLTAVVAASLVLTGVLLAEPWSRLAQKKQR